MKDDALALALYFLVLGAVITGISLGFMRAGMGHQAPSGWQYDAYCCSGQDCEPIDPARVQVVPGGYLLDGRHSIPEAQARQAPDGNYHACFWPGPDTLRCFYKPAVGS